MQNGSQVLFEVKVLSEATKLTHKSIKRIQEYEPEEGYHLAFSGGKDSIVTEHLASRANVRYTSHFGMTTIDPPEILKFIKQHYPNVVMHRPEHSMFKLISDVKHSLPLRGSRFCCEYLKEYLGAGEVVMQGIRWEESNKRKQREIFEVDTREYRLHFKMYLNPIIDWLTIDIWDYIDHHGLPYPEAYDNGSHRLGCVGCPVQQAPAHRKDLEMYPRFKNMYLKAIKKAREAKKKNGEYYAIRTRFADEYEALDWWTSGLSIEEYMHNKYKQTKLEL
jgi:phosphoadenosine phosphosulfate reductase